MSLLLQEITQFIKDLYKNDIVPLHAPVFLGNEKEYLKDCIDSTFVSYVGKYVVQFEEMTTQYTGAKYAVAVVNGTVALQVALQIAGVKRDDEVITQPLTFVATANAISHCGAKPVFVDVDIDTLGMSPDNLDDWLSKNAKINIISNNPINRSTNRRISAIVPVHTFGHPCRIDDIVEIGNKYNIPVIEDSAESIGSLYKGKHTGTFGLAGIISYNGNKTITTGGGGMIITDDVRFAQKAKHITTTGKVPHRWEFIHDIVAFNYRLTNVNAALGVAQMEKIDSIIENKRHLAKIYYEYFKSNGIRFVSEPPNSRSNYWLNTILFDNRNKRDEFLEYTNDNNVITRPAWKLIHTLGMYRDCQKGSTANSDYFYNRIVNVPSGIRIILNE
jgi:perosamine synthetase